MARRGVINSLRLTLTLTLTLSLPPNKSVRCVSRMVTCVLSKRDGDIWDTPTRPIAIRASAFVSAAQPSPSHQMAKSQPRRVQTPVSSVNALWSCRDTSSSPLGRLISGQRPRWCENCCFTSFRHGLPHHNHDSPSGSRMVHTVPFHSIVPTTQTSAGGSSAKPTILLARQLELHPQRSILCLSYELRV